MFGPDGVHHSIALLLLDCCCDLVLPFSFRHGVRGFEHDNCHHHRRLPRDTAREVTFFTCTLPCANKPSLTTAEGLTYVFGLNPCVFTRVSEMIGHH